MNDGRIRIGVAIVVTFVWAISYVTSIVNRAYHPPPEVNAVMLLVAAFFFSPFYTRGKGDK